MTRNYLNEILELLENGSNEHKELTAAIYLLFNRIELEDICKLKISDVYDAHGDVRSHIRRLKTIIPAALKARFDWYLNYLDSSEAYYEQVMLLPSYRDPILLAQHLEDHGAPPERVFSFGEKCYAEHLCTFQ